LEIALVETCSLKKYFWGPRFRCLGISPKMEKGLPIFILLLSTLPINNNYLTWIPGNGKLIKLWDDPIMKPNSLSHCADLNYL
jgi:hypothetical protein